MLSWFSGVVRMLRGGRKRKPFDIAETPFKPMLGPYRSLGLEWRVSTAVPRDEVWFSNGKRVVGRIKLPG